MPRPVVAARLVGAAVAFVVAAASVATFAATAAAQDDVCALLDATAVSRLFGPVSQPTSTTVGALPGCQIEAGSLALTLIDAGARPHEFDVRLADRSPDEVQHVSDYLDDAFFGWGVDGALDFVARRDDQVRVLRLTGTSARFEFDSTDPTSSAPDGDVSGTEVGSSMWAIMTGTYALDESVAVPAADDLNGLWRTADITPCAPASSVGVRVSNFVDDGGGGLRSLKVAGDTCLDDGEVDFEGDIADGSGSGVSFASIGTSSSAQGTPYELTVLSPTEVTLTGAAGALQYTLRYQRLSWPGLAVEGERPALLGIPSPSEALTPRNMVLTGVLTSLLMMIVVLPTSLFNNALSANLEHYRQLLDRFLRRVLVRSDGDHSGEDAPDSARRFWGSWRGVVIYVLLAGVIFSLMQPGWGPNTVTVIALLGFIGGVAISNVLSVTATSLYLLVTKRNGRGTATVEPATLGIAMLFVVASRVVGFLPGYMYGVLVNWASEEERDDADKGRILVISSSISLVAALVAWQLIPLFRGFAASNPGVLGAVPLSVVGGLFTRSVGTLTIGLIPVRFMPGFTLKERHRRTWAVLWTLGGALFVLVLLRPGLVSGASRNIVGTVALVVVACALALAFWSYESRRSQRDTPVAPPPPPRTEAPTPPPPSPTTATSTGGGD